MNKKLVIFVCCTIALVGASSTSSFAETLTAQNASAIAIEKSEDIDNLQEFKSLMEEEQNEDITLSAKKEMIANVGAEIIINYENEKMTDAAELINEKCLEFSNVNVEANGDSFASTSVDLGDGATLFVSFSDVEEPSLLDSLRAKIGPIFVDTVYADTTDSIKAVDIYQYYEGYKDYGNRYYTATYKLKYLIGYMTIVTENHYTISSSGLTERYGDTNHDYRGYFDNITDSWKITDATASSAGYDINILGTVKYDRTNEVFPNHGPVYLQQDTRVKLLALDKTNKRAKVSQYAYILRSFPTL